MCDTHRPFDRKYGDRARQTHEEAIALAERRAALRGRQTVRRHTGPFFKRGVWFIQDLDVPDARSTR